MTNIRLAVGLFSMRDVAREMELHQSKFQRGVAEGWIFRPKHGNGRRKYYTAADVERIRELLGRNSPKMDN